MSKAQAMKSSQGFRCGFLLFVVVDHCSLIFSAVVTTLSYSVCGSPGLVYKERQEGKKDTLISPCPGQLGEFCE